MKNSPKLHWFKAKRYGLGWVPASLEGWLVTLGYTLILALSVYLFTTEFSTLPISLGSTVASDVVLAGFFLWILMITSIMLWICYKTGDPLDWHWGG